MSTSHLFNYNFSCSLSRCFVCCRWQKDKWHFVLFELRKKRHQQKIRKNGDKFTSLNICVAKFSFGFSINSENLRKVDNLQQSLPIVCCLRRHEFTQLQLENSIGQITSGNQMRWQCIRHWLTHMWAHMLLEHSLGSRTSESSWIVYCRLLCILKQKENHRLSTQPNNQAWLLSGFWPTDLTNPLPDWTIRNILCISTARQNPIFILYTTLAARRDFMCCQINHLFSQTQTNIVRPWHWNEVTLSLFCLTIVWNFTNVYRSFIPHITEISLWKWTLKFLRMKILFSGDTKMNMFDSVLRFDTVSIGHIPFQLFDFYACDQLLKQ